MNRKLFLAAASAAFVFSAAQAALAQDSVKIGFILPMTGQQQSTGKQIAAAMKLYMAQNGDIIQNVYIRKVEKKNGELYNVEFATFLNVKDPIKAAEKK